MKANNSNRFETAAQHAPVHPAVFTLLFLPTGIMAGYVTVTLAWLFAKEGISVEKIAALVAAILIPHIFRFIWAPLVDSTLSLKKWYLIANVISAFGILMTGVLPIKESSLSSMAWYVLGGTGIDMLFLKLDIRYQYGLNQLIKDVETSGTSSASFDTKNQMFVVSLGFKIFGKK